MAFSPDSRYIVTTDDRNVIQIWEVRTGNLIASIGKPADNIAINNETALADSKPERVLNYATFSPDGQYVIVARNNNKAQLYLWRYFRPTEQLLNRVSKLVRGQSSE